MKTAGGRLLHIVSPVKAKLVAEQRKCVGLLATRGTVAAGIYQRRLGDAMEVIVPTAVEQEWVDTLIRNVKAGRKEFPVGRSVAESLLSRGAERVILGCTELPIAFAGSPLEHHCLDATAALAEACVIACGGRVKGHEATAGSRPSSP